MIDLAQDLKNKTAPRVRHLAINCPFYKRESALMDACKSNNHVLIISNSNYLWGGWSHNHFHSDKS